MNNFNRTKQGIDNILGVQKSSVLFFVKLNLYSLSPETNKKY